MATRAASKGLGREGNKGWAGEWEGEWEGEWKGNGGRNREWEGNSEGKGIVKQFSLEDDISHDIVLQLPNNIYQ